MPNLLFIGFPEEIADQIIDKLVEDVPLYMEETVYKAYPKEAPRFATTKDYAPYIIVRDTDIERMVYLKDAICRVDVGLNGIPDIEMQQIEYYFPGTINPMIIGGDSR